MKHIDKFNHLLRRNITLSQPGYWRRASLYLTQQQGAITGRWSSTVKPISPQSFTTRLPCFGGSTTYGRLTVETSSCSTRLCPGSSSSTMCTSSSSGMHASSCSSSNTRCVIGSSRPAPFTAYRGGQRLNKILVPPPVAMAGAAASPLVAATMSTSVSVTARTELTAVIPYTHRIDQSTLLQRHQRLWCGDLRSLVVSTSSRAVAATRSVRRMCASMSGAATAGVADADAALGGMTSLGDEYESTSASDGGFSTATEDGSDVDGGRNVEFVTTTRDEDTIASIVTGMAHGSVAIIRLSGTDAVQMASKVFRPGGRYRLGWRPQSHRVYYGTAVDSDENLLDEVLLLVMLTPRSYTAEDVVELHCHGGGVCAARVMRSLIEAGARPAKPGEFTLRAFLNGRLDLAQAEAVSELLGARTPAAADSALAGLRGGVGGAVGDLRSRCLDVLVELEARLDFDEDLPPLDLADLKRRIERIQAGIEGALRTARAGGLLRRGLQVAIVGRPNVGKSSLLNSWTNSDRAIVTEIAGTTRDVLEASLSVGGVPVTLLDTAGIREADNVVEKIGVERSQAAAAAADVVLMVVDGAAGWTEEDGAIYSALWGDGPGTANCKVKGLALLVANKDDLRAHQHSDTTTATTTTTVTTTATTTATTTVSNEAATTAPQPTPSSSLSLPVLARETFSAVVHTSATQRRGLQQLDQELLRLVGAPQLASGGVSWSVNERQAEALVRSHEALMRLSQSISTDMPLDCWTIDLRSALIALGEVNGEEVGEQVLDAVFSRFCIGK